MLKHEEMIENVHRRIAQYEAEKKMKHSSIKNLFSAIKPDSSKDKNNGEGYIEVVSSTERIEPSHRILRVVSTLAAGAVLVTGIGATGVLLHRNKPLKPAVTEEDSNLNEVDTPTQPAEIIKGDPFSEMLACKYDLVFPNLDFTDTMREKIKELFDSQESWKTASDYNRFLHYDNGCAYSLLNQRVILGSDKYWLQICDDNIIEYAVLEDLNWKKKFYECDSLALINGIADIIESELEDNGVDFDEDVSDFRRATGTETSEELSDIQKRLLSLCLKGSSWKMETMQANRDSSLFDLSLVSPSSGRLDIIADNIYADSNTGFALFTDKNGITYTCEDNIYFSNNIIYIMSEYDYPDIKTEITITDGDGKEIISSDDNNRARLESFIYYEMPSLLNRYTDYHYPNDYAVNRYNIDISYSSGDTKLRSTSYSISNFGVAERQDCVLDPVYNWSPAGGIDYYLDILAFEDKLDVLIGNKQEEKAPEDKKPEDKKSEEVQPTTENRKDEDKSSNEENQQETNSSDSPTENNSEEIENTEDYSENFLIPKAHVFISFSDQNDEEEIIATYKTHDNDALDAFVEKVFEPMLDPVNGNFPDNSYRRSGYMICRIYETDNTYMSDKGKYMMRDSYYIGDNGHASSCSYIYVNGDWEPAGAENFYLDYAKFEEILQEFLKTSKIPKE